MDKSLARRDILLLVLCFLISRVIIKVLHISFGYHALFEYWQYLDVNVLRHDLLSGLWYLHSQPPVFNFFLGLVLKFGFSHAAFIFECIFMFVSITNACLLLVILRNVTDNKILPFLFSLFYLLSPATILYENELFYTSLISMLLLLLVWFVLRFHSRSSAFNAAGIFTSVSLLCLTRSTYHLLWLLPVCLVLLNPFLNTGRFRILLAGALLSVCLVGGWYTKNYLLFNKFSASSWLGINFARIVFHDVPVYDSTNIASVHPFYPVSYYRKFFSAQQLDKYSGLNDKVLLREVKNDSFVNMNHVAYLQVSDRYMAASMDYIAIHPGSYFKNAFKSFIIFFSPASSYFKLDQNNRRLKYYDLVYSFNLAHLVHTKDRVRVALALSAIPKLACYLAVFFILVRDAARRRFLSTVNLVIFITILFSLAASTLFEYGENMRFRYEIEPLFLVLAGQAVTKITWKKRKAPVY